MYVAPSFIKNGSVNLDVVQMLKFGLHIGGGSVSLPALVYCGGKKNGLVFNDPDRLVFASRRLIFLIRKLSSKRAGLFSPISGAGYRALEGPRFMRLRSKPRGGLLTNKQVLRKLSSRAYSKDYISLRASDNLLTDQVRSVIKHLPKTPKKRSAIGLRNRQKLSLPTLYCFYKERRDSYYGLLESRHKKVISFGFINAQDNPDCFHYSLMGNNSSYSSLAYFLKILRTATK